MSGMEKLDELFKMARRNVSVAHNQDRCPMLCFALRPNMYEIPYGLSILSEILLPTK